MKQLIAALAVVSTACGVDSRTDGFRDGFPQTSTVALQVPGSSTAQPLTGQHTRRDGLEGDTAVFYSFTRDVTVMVNGGVAAELSLVERIASNPATTVSADGAIWGPYTEALSPNTWRFSVNRRAPNDFAYVLEGKAKTAPDSAYVAVLSGTHVSAGKAYGNGSFLLDWQAASTLPEHDANLGQALFTYARPSASDATTVDVTFNQVKDSESGQLVDAAYHYRTTPGQGGTLAFQMDKNFYGGPAIELLTVNSRWLETGAGRADVRLTGADLGAAGATVNECWDTNFLSRYFVASFDPAAHWGTETVCALPTAEYARP